LVTTNNHVVAGASRIKVILVEKREFKAKVKGADRESPVITWLNLTGSIALADRSAWVDLFLASGQVPMAYPNRSDYILIGSGVASLFTKSSLVPIDSLPHQMVEKIDTEQGRRIYPQRLVIAEPVFANIRINKRLDRFTLRGKIKVNIQWLMYCLVHNIEKILNYGMAYAQRQWVDETHEGHKC
jgi:hypothetical protein